MSEASRRREANRRPGRSGPSAPFEFESSSGTFGAFGTNAQMLELLMAWVYTQPLEGLEMIIEELQDFRTAATASKPGHCCDCGEFLHGPLN